MGEPDADVRRRAARIRLVLLDVDGVLTDGRLLIDADGRETKAFDVRDGLGIRLGREAGLTFAIVSGRRSDAVTHRAAELGIEEVHQRIHDKRSHVDAMLERLDLGAEAACFIGDDLIDLPVMRRCGLAVAPADATAEARAAAHHVTSRQGGQGAVRELVELLLHASGKWTEVAERYSD